MAALPRVHVAHETVVTPWEQKGLVMRTLVELSKDRDVVLVDGVKVLHDDGWALALPDPEEPITHVWAEGRATPTPAAWPRSTPAASARCCAELEPRGSPSTVGRGRRNVLLAFGAMNVPEDLRYSTDHEWVRLEDGKVRIGITDYAQDALGDVVFVQIPEVGAAVASTAKVQRGRVDQVGVATSTPRSSGTVVEVNADLADTPERLNEDPYGEGWICVIEPDRCRPSSTRCSTPRATGSWSRAEEARRRWPTCSATTAGTATPSGSNFCSSCGAVLETQAAGRTRRSPSTLDRAE